MKQLVDHVFSPRFWVRQHRSGAAWRDEGQSLVELALMLPLLLMLLAGLIFGGITFYDYVTLADAVEAGARMIVTNQGAGKGPPTACTLGENALTSAAANLKTSQITISGGAGGETFTGTSKCTSLQTGDYVTLGATYPCYLKIPFAGINLCPVQNSNGSFISSTTTMRIE
jgi:Flp pilus assembly protein TadG